MLPTSSCCSEGAFLSSSISTSLKTYFGSNSFRSTLSGARNPCKGQGKGGEGKGEEGEGERDNSVITPLHLHMYFAHDEYLSRLNTRGLRLGGVDPREELLQHPHEWLVVLRAKHLQEGNGEGQTSS